MLDIECRHLLTKNPHLGCFLEGNNDQCISKPGQGGQTVEVGIQPAVGQREDLRIDLA